MLKFEFASKPVKNGHKIIANALNTGFPQTANIFAIIINKTVGVSISQFNILVNGNAFYNLKFQTVRLGFVFNVKDTFLTPNLTNGYIIHSRYNTAHCWNLRNFFQGYGITITIPTEC